MRKKKNITGSITTDYDNDKVEWKQRGNYKGAYKGGAKGVILSKYDQYDQTLFGVHALDTSL